MSNIIKRTVERENLSAVFFCEFFHSKIVYREEKIREEQGLVPKLKYKYQLKVNGRYAESALTMKYAEGKAMIIIGEKLNGSIPSVAKAIAEKDADLIRERAKMQSEAGAPFLDVCASVEEDVEVETLKWMIDLVQEVSDTPICISGGR